MYGRSTIPVAALLLLAGCGYDASNATYPSPPAATISLSLSSADPLTSAGDMVTVRAVVRDAAGTILPAAPLTWHTSAPAVATLSATGDVATVTAVGDGSAVISATSGSIEGQVTVTVHRQVASLSLTVPDPVIVAGATMQLAVVARDARGQPFTALPDVTFTTDNPFSVAISPTGLVTALFSPQRPFSALVTATLTSDGVTLSDAKRIDVSDPAPPAFELSSLLLPEDVRPEPVVSAASAIVYFTRVDSRVDYKILWALLSAPPTVAHIHASDVFFPDLADVVVDLPLGSQTSRNGTSSGSFSANDIRGQGGRPPISLDSLLTLMRRPGLAYVDLDDGAFSGGEVRGPITAR
ncbi:MAG TPA: CHRD domain-containing protein [Gemmatimonadaceae bacterium]|nr:CHRD domain-containing protein [Gemmatimonadaceae bacterium]